MKETFAKQYDAAKFTWKNGEGIAVASELGIEAGDVPYDHDAGLNIKSPKTGVVKRFALVDVTSYNGDTVKWIFESLDNNPKLIVTIYND